MTREEKLAGVAALAPWFHCIDLGDGVVTKSASLAGEGADHPRPTWRIVERHLPADLTGLDVLDVGCNAGFYAIEARRRGARRVLGVEARRTHVAQARFAARALGLDIEYRRASVYDLRPSAVGTFDVTLALGLIYHCKHLMLALERLALVTRRTMLLETEIYPPRRWPRSFDRVHAGDRQRVHTLGFVENPPDAPEAAYNWFLPSVKSLPALIRQGGFDEVEVVKVWGWRALCVCRKASEVPDSRTPRGLQAAIAPERDRVTCAPGEVVRLAVGLENTGPARWLAAGTPGTGTGAIQLGAHLCTDAADLEWEYGRAGLGADVEPGGSARVTIALRAPDAPGRYRVELDLVSEHVSWFEDLGSPLASVGLLVEGAPARPV